MARTRETEKGTVIVLVALLLISLVVVVALVVDVGHAYVKKAELKNALDAAALAGAQFLPDETAAAAKAVDYAGLNGVTLANNGTDIKFTRDAIGKAYRIDCQAALTVPLYFGPAVGVNEWQVKALSRAHVGAAKKVGGYGALPFAILEQDFSPGGLYTLKNDDKIPSPGGGWFGALDITRNPGDVSGGEDRDIPEAHGGNRYKDNVIGGLNFDLKIGDNLSLEPGNMVGPTDQGMQARIESCPLHGAGCWSGPPAYVEADPRCARFVVIPVVVETGGRPQFDIVAFASFYVEGQPAGGQVDARFINVNLSVDADVSEDSFPAYGLTGVKLIQ
ncbi:MAG: pilus assembly protein TadG-related protein [Heliobacteriaceae bacterium]|nr:pilus assembly protein TadG-related protein [Heliobacteriaceae bacterium]MDD4588305.1 pilus assembly protein TadG-related protein [Heliobacteriaceae bacterium]